MALQSSDLVMVSLGVRGDTPPIELQPQLVDGIHLRWAFRRQRGFPWYGYHLFRRPHEERGERCLAAEFAGLAGQPLGRRLTTPLGELSSGRPLVLDEAGVPVLDLTGRTRVRLDLPQGGPAHRIRLELAQRFLPPDSAPPRIVVTLWDGPVELARDVLSPRPGQSDSAAYAFDRITAVEIGGGAAGLVDLCAALVPDSALKGWEPVSGFPQPLALPLTHPDYPAAPGVQDEDAAWARAMARVRYDDGTDWASGFSGLHEQLVRMVQGGAGVPMAARTRATTSVPGVSPTIGTAGPSLPALHPLDMVLLGAVHPAFAQQVGLYWADDSTQPDASYDYLLVADRQGVGPDVLGHVERHGFGAVDAWITFDRRMAATSPPDPPTGVRAYALPGGTYRARDGAGLQVAAGNVGVVWSDDRDSLGYLRTGRPVAHHVWRARLGGGEEPEAFDEATELVTATGPVLATTPATVRTRPPQRPGDWPPFTMPFLDIGLDEGWYGYLVSGIDLFGRWSACSRFATWHQWAPEPDPTPWYYRDPPGDQAVHPSSVRVLDRSRPPPPAGLLAWALDPDDPLVVVDEAAAAWRAALTEPATVGLRARWRWTVAQQRQAPDVTEFRIYWSPGRTVPQGWEEQAAWPVRTHVTAALTATDPSSDQEYEVFLPVAVGEGPFGAGLPLEPSLAEPIAYANVTVTAADGADVPDGRPGSGPLAPRRGNEGRAASPARVYRVRRERPAAPDVVVGAEPVYATAADWHGRSVHTFRWVPQAGVAVHVLRALDESVFAADRAVQPRDPLNPDHPAFPDGWDAARRLQVCDALDALAEGARDGSSYRSLSDDALRVLAALPGCEKAFTQLTATPLDPAAADGRGPDDPADYLPRDGVAAYQDILDGRARNRYLYRAVGVDAAGNRSLAGPVGAPVRLPDVVPPRIPTVTAVTAGDRAITLSWAANREPDLAEYHVYRATTAVDAQDVRSMTLVAALAAVDAAAPAAAVVWTDKPVRGLTDFWYRVVAVDRPDPDDPRGGGGNASMPSGAVRGRALQPTPTAPVLDPPTWDGAHTTVTLRWALDDALLMARVERRTDEGNPWTVAVDWLPEGTTTATDAPPDPTVGYEYRIRVRDHVRQQAVGDPVPTG